MMDKQLITRFIENALAEDLGSGDITTSCTVPEETVISGRLICKAEGILCGADIAKAVFGYVDTSVSLEFYFADGDSLKKGDVLARIEGCAASILKGERLALNMLQRLSGIATRTGEAAASVAGFAVKITDTRKTTPGLRIFEKYAVRTGGGYNHRFNLSDGILIKDNHIRAAGGIKKAVDSAKLYAPHTLKIEVEVETLEQVKEALKAGADIIMLDNMDTETMKQAVKLINKNALVEASGGMGEKNLREVASAGVDLISIGALTNNIKPLDISLDFD